MTLADSQCRRRVVGISAMKDPKLRGSAVGGTFDALDAADMVRLTEAAETDDADVAFVVVSENRVGLASDG
jgi:hypothetical protein